MSGRPFFSLRAHLFLLALIVLGAASLPGSPSSCAERPMESKGPVVITSSTLNADNKAHTALFEGSVVAKTESMTLYSDRMLVYSSEEGKVTKMEASGHVKLIKGEKIITSDEAVYFADEDKAVFTGQPKAVEGGTMVIGTKMTYLLSEDRSMVENGRVFLEKGISKGR
ncbi:MAG TPA: LptA/OstA family protein [Thermodesulfovibrionales bacterium]|nr:LptA/OstA family protein [Thermodesulfovibrionales bacterium]